MLPCLMKPGFRFNRGGPDVTNLARATSLSVPFFYPEGPFLMASLFCKVFVVNWMDS